MIIHKSPNIDKQLEIYTYLIPCSNQSDQSSTSPLDILLNGFYAQCVWVYANNTHDAEIKAIEKLMAMQHDTFSKYKGMISYNPYTYEVYKGKLPISETIFLMARKDDVLKSSWKDKYDEYKKLQVDPFTLELIDDSFDPSGLEPVLPL